MQGVLHTAITLRRDAIKRARGKAVRFGEFLLGVRALFVVQLVDGFDRATIDQAGNEARFVYIRGVSDDR